MKNNDLDKNKYKELVSEVELKKIELVSSSVSRPLSMPGQLHMEVKHEIETLSLTSDMLVVLFKMDVRGEPHSESASDGDNDFLISCTFVVSYALKGNQPPQEDVLEAFINRNVPVNVWPYCREFVSSTTTRMGLPPFFLRLLKAW